MRQNYFDLPVDIDIVMQEVADFGYEPDFITGITYHEFWDSYAKLLDDMMEKAIQNALFRISHLTTLLFYAKLKLDNCPHQKDNLQESLECECDLFDFNDVSNINVLLDKKAVVNYKHKWMFVAHAEALVLMGYMVSSEGIDWKEDDEERQYSLTDKALALIDQIGYKKATTNDEIAVVIKDMMHNWGGKL